MSIIKSIAEIRRLTKKLSITIMTKLPKYIANKGKPWTKDEEKKLVSLGGKVPTGVIGLKLQRPVNGVRAKAQELGLSLKPVNKSPRSKLK